MARPKKKKEEKVAPVERGILDVWAYLDVLKEKGKSVDVTLDGLRKSLSDLSFIDVFAGIISWTNKNPDYARKIIKTKSGKEYSSIRDIPKEEIKSLEKDIDMVWRINSN